MKAMGTHVAVTPGSTLEARAQAELVLGFMPSYDVVLQTNSKTTIVL